MISQMSRIAICFAGLILSTSFSAWGQDKLATNQHFDWWQFRGPLGRGILEGNVELPNPLDPQKPRWQIAVPPGHSSPIIVGDRVVLTAYHDQVFSTLCYDLKTGQQRWQHRESATEVEKTHPQHGPASCTPTSDGQRIVTVFGSLGARCFDLDGKLLWQIDRPNQANLFGSAASPIIYDQRLILFFATEVQSLLMAVEPTSGKVLWKKERMGPASSWSTPTIWESPTGRQILYYEPFHLRSVSWDGEELWSVPGLADEPITVPQVSGELVLTTSYNLRTNREAQGLPTFAQLLEECDANKDGLIGSEESRANQSILSRPDADGQGDHPLRMFFRLLDENKDGQIAETEWPRIHQWMDPWSHANGLIAIRPGKAGEPANLDWTHADGVPECPTPLVLDHRIYLVRNGGVVTCVDATTGKTLSQERLAGGGPYYASPIAADGKIYLASARGQITVLETRKGSLEKLAMIDLREAIFATPALSAQGMVVRTEKSLICF